MVNRLTEIWSQSCQSEFFNFGGEGEGGKTILVSITKGYADIVWHSLSKHGLCITYDIWYIVKHFINIHLARNGTYITKFIIENILYMPKDHLNRFQIPNQE